jgi:hypothetical protein
LPSLTVEFISQGDGGYSQYVAPFLPLLWLAAFSSLLGAATHVSRRAAIAVVLAAVSVTGLRVAKSAVSDIVVGIFTRQNTDGAVAKELRGLGVMPGDRVSGLSRVAEAHWARLAGVKIVSEIPLGEEGIFWSAPPEEKRRVFRVFAATGATVVVTRTPPIDATEEGWIRWQTRPSTLTVCLPNRIDLNSEISPTALD